MKSLVRVVIPDFHGAHIDLPAANACIADVKALAPNEIVYLGDGIDCAGTFSTHQRNYTNEMAEALEDDVSQANWFVGSVEDHAPRAASHYIEGNHEGHIERWASRVFFHKKDADGFLDRSGPEKLLRLKERGIRYYKRSEHYMGLSIPGAIKLGRCYFVHGVSHSKHAAASHLEAFGANICFGHVHRSMSVISRTVSADGYGAWCPGTLAKLQPLYKHTAPTTWSHGYAVQFINASGRFLHLNVPILNGQSMLMDVARRLRP